MKLKTLFLCILALALSYSPYALADEGMTGSLKTDRFTAYDGSTKTISNGQYIGGGVVSLLMGLGVGLAVQGRYAESNGWIFTVGGLATTGGVVTGLVLFSRSKPGDNNMLPLGLILGSVAIGSGLRIWEIITTWKLPSHYQIAKNRFQMKPLAYYNQGDLNLGLSLKYKF